MYLFKIKRKINICIYIYIYIYINKQNSETIQLDFNWILNKF